MILKKEKKESGQMMILLVIVVSAVSLSAMALSSFLVVSQLKQVTDARFSGAALFAADEGGECILLHEFNNGVYGTTGCPSYPQTPEECTGVWSGEATISGGGSYQFKCDNLQSDANKKYFISVGKDKPGEADRITRILQLTLVRK